MNSKCWLPDCVKKVCSSLSGKSKDGLLTTITQASWPVKATRQNLYRPQPETSLILGGEQDLRFALGPEQVQAVFPENLEVSVTPMHPKWPWLEHMYVLTLLYVGYMTHAGGYGQTSTHKIP